MKILICSDGTPAAESAIQLGGLLAIPLKAETTLFGTAEKSQDEASLREALEKQAQPIRSQNVALDIIVHAGEPIREILDRTSKTSYDLVVIGARWTGATGNYWRSQKTYEVIKAIQPPVLVAIGECKHLSVFLFAPAARNSSSQRYSSQADWLRQLMRP